MGWSKFDDAYPHHPKILAAGESALALDVCGVCYAAKHETNGFVPDGALNLLGPIKNPRRAVAALMKVERWERDDKAGGWWIHDYLEYNPSAEQRDTERGIARRRWALNNNPELAAQIKARDKNLCRYCGVKVNWRDRKSPTGATYDHVVPIPRGNDSYENIVTACRSCNQKKGSRTPEESNMILLAPPDLSNQTKPENLDLSSNPPDPFPTRTPPHPGLGDVEKSPEPRDLVARLNLACKNPNTEEAARVIDLLTDHVDESLIDKCIGWTQDLPAKERPRRPAYFLTTVADWGRKNGVEVPELRLVAVS